MAKSRRLIWCLVILVILASFGAAAGFYLLYQEKAHAESADTFGEHMAQASTGAVEDTAPIYLKLEPFTVNLAEELIGIAPEEVRLDTCCHFNAHGTAEIAQPIAAVVHELLAAQ